MPENDDREQRTEAATPRRREEARERGQVALSSELVSAVGLAAGVGVLSVGGAALARAVAATMEHGLRALGDGATRELTVPESAALLEGPVTGVLRALCMVGDPTLLDL